jgi:hypothetical protein
MKREKKQPEAPRAQKRQRLALEKGSPEKRLRRPRVLGKQGPPPKNDERATRKDWIAPRKGKSSVEHSRRS